MGDNAPSLDKPISKPLCVKERFLCLVGRVGRAPGGPD
jgi:hypothetical protein